MKIIVTAPTRIGLFGGGTDVPSYSELYGGVVINMAINIYQKFEFDTETLSEPTILYENGKSEKFYQAFFDEFEFDKHWSQVFDGNLESGLGSSASAAVALVAGLSKLKGIEVTRKEIAEKAFDIEVNKFKMYGGRQDQYASAFGGMNLWEFDKSNIIVQRSFDRRFADHLASNIMLFYLGFNRKSTKIQENLKELSQEQIGILDKIKAVAQNAEKYIFTGNIKKLGKLLDYSWELKKKSNNVSNDKIDQIYKTVMEAGALGGKLCVSGDGGHMIFLVEKEKQDQVERAIGLKRIDWSIDWNGVMVRKI